MSLLMQRTYKISADEKKTVPKWQLSKIHSRYFSLVVSNCKGYVVYGKRRVRWKGTERFCGFYFWNYICIDRKPFDGHTLILKEKHV
jgi:hypothetical protein